MFKELMALYDQGMRGEKEARYDEFWADVQYLAILMKTLARSMSPKVEKVSLQCMLQSRLASLAFFKSVENFSIELWGKRYFFQHTKVIDLLNFPKEKNIFEIICSNLKELLEDYAPVIVKLMSGKETCADQIMEAIFKSVDFDSRTVTEVERNTLRECIFGFEKKQDRQHLAVLWLLVTYTYVLMKKDYQYGDFYISYKKVFLREFCARGVKSKELTQDELVLARKVVERWREFVKMKIEPQEIAVYRRPKEFGYVSKNNRGSIVLCFLQEMEAFENTVCRQIQGVLSMQEESGFFKSKKPVFILASGVIRICVPKFLENLMGELAKKPLNPITLYLQLMAIEEKLTPEQRKNLYGVISFFLYVKGLNEQNKERALATLNGLSHKYNIPCHTLNDCVRLFSAATENQTNDAWFLASRASVTL